MLAETILKCRKIFVQIHTHEMGSCFLEENINNLSSPDFVIRILKIG